MTRFFKPLIACSVIFLACITLLPANDAMAQAGKKAEAPKKADPFGGFGSSNSKDPIRIDANKLEVFDKEQKAIYSGDVIAVRGTATTRSTVMTIFYDSKKAQEKKEGAAPAKSATSQPQDGALKRIEFTGPVSVVNGTQTMTSNTMVYDAIGKIVTLTGNAVVADGPNVQRGELMTYNTETGIATIINPTPGGRVQGVFTPGSQDEGKPKGQGKKNNGAQPTN
jgi:lipopolysaccharide export system protein LptA